MGLFFLVTNRAIDDFQRRCGCCTKVFHSCKKIPRPKKIAKSIVFLPAEFCQIRSQSALACQGWHDGRCLASVGIAFRSRRYKWGQKIPFPCRRFLACALSGPDRYLRVKDGTTGGILLACGLSISNRYLRCWQAAHTTPDFPPDPASDRL